MAPHQAPAAAATATAAGNEGDHRQRTVTIHILSPSLPGSDRFTLHGVPLRITVGELRGLIAESFPGHPGPSAQRLIHRGRPLVHDGHRLFRVLGPVEVGLQLSQLLLTSYLLESHLTKTSPRIMSSRFTWSYHSSQPPMTIP
jgi:hypothetical protein